MLVCYERIGKMKVLIRCKQYTNVLADSGDDGKSMFANRSMATASSFSLSLFVCGSDEISPFSSSSISVEEQNANALKQENLSALIAL